MGGGTLYESLNRPSGAMLQEIDSLEAALDRGDWHETQTIVTHLAPRLIGDLSTASRYQPNGSGHTIDDPSLPPNTSPYHAGGGRLGFERDAFVLGGGVQLLLRVFREPAFVGPELARSNDARDLSPPVVMNKLSVCWTEVLASLRELVYAMPVLVETGEILENGDFLPFLFSLLAHDSCFEGAAALIEEILSLQSQSPPSASNPAADTEAPVDREYRAMTHATPVTTFFLGNVPDLYELWQGFSCRQLAQFCRILALLVFEPEDRQLLESPAVLKSLELLQLRRDRAARAGQDATVDMNQSILLGDRVLMQRLLQLLKIMNFAPNLQRSSAYHVMAHFSFIADTLIMLGLSEMDDWQDIDRLEGLAKSMLLDDDIDHDDDTDDTVHNNRERPRRVRNTSELGSVAGMLENLSTVFMGNQSETTSQLGHIIHVINAAQQAGVVVGRQRRRRTGTNGGRSNQQSGSNRPQAAQRRQQVSQQQQQQQQQQQAPTVHVSAIPVDPIEALDDLASAARTLTNQMNIQRNFVRQDDPEATVQVVGVNIQGGGSSGEPTVHHLHTSGTGRIRINTPEDAANELQFNALALAPYQVEVLFVVCTLLGGRRKIDAQHFLDENDLIPTLDDMFHRLSWGSSSQGRNNNDGSSARRPSATSTADTTMNSSSDGVDGTGTAQPSETIIVHGTIAPIQDEFQQQYDAQGGQPQQPPPQSQQPQPHSVQGPDPAESEVAEQPQGIHGPGCECTPENALCVQYLRLLHNFCDRDCDNYGGRRLLLSPEEREYVSSERNWLDGPEDRPSLRKGLFSKIVGAFMSESDDSPYRFWLASCAESFLRGSSAHEQLFAAKSGLLLYLVKDVISDRLHCAGSLQTSFDLLGELCKGNSESLHLLVSSLDEESFRKLMSAAAANLVDSNVFLRSLLLSVERISAAKVDGCHDEIDSTANPWKDHSFGPWTGKAGLKTRYYLTHSWWDAVTSTVQGLNRQGRKQAYICLNELRNDNARSSDWFPLHRYTATSSALGLTDHDGALDASVVGYNGWLFSPLSVPLPSSPQDPFGWAMSEAVFAANTIERLTWFLITNQSRLLRDLLSVVDLGNINHENICCLNTAVVVAMFASRRLQLGGVLQELKRLSEEDKVVSKQRKRDLQKQFQDKHGAGGLLTSHGINDNTDGTNSNSGLVFLDPDDLKARPFRPGMLRRLPSNVSDNHDILTNFRELLWFWSEYYVHRGRDRLSLEFSSHVRFREWYHVVSQLTADHDDDASVVALCHKRIRLPKSPYHRAPRIADSPRRWENAANNTV